MLHLIFTHIVIMDKFYFISSKDKPIKQQSHRCKKMPSDSDSALLVL
jgi:hypothetical protein